MSEEVSPLDEQRAVATRLTDAAREGCWCEPLRKPCERHDAFEDGVLAVLAEMHYVGYWHPSYGFEGPKHGLHGPNNSGDFVYVFGRSGTP